MLIQFFVKYFIGLKYKWNLYPLNRGICLIVLELYDLASPCFGHIERGQGNMQHSCCFRTIVFYIYVAHAKLFYSYTFMQNYQILLIIKNEFSVETKKIDKYLAIMIMFRFFEYEK
jgi:hypothetical protein